jgi:BMFP domain-containing protein YqiC
MLNKKILEEIGSKVNEVLEHSPAKDVEKNLRVLLSGVFTRLDLVSRQEFDVQEEVLMRTREKLIKLETRVSAMENQLGLNTAETTDKKQSDQTE